MKTKMAKNHKFQSYKTSVYQVCGYVLNIREIPRLSTSLVDAEDNTTDLNHVVSSLNPTSGK